MGHFFPHRPVEHRLPMRKVEFECHNLSPHIPITENFIGSQNVCVCVLWRLLSFLSLAQTGHIGTGENTSWCLCSITPSLFVCCCFTIATVFQLYHGGEMMYKKRRKKAWAYTFTNSRNFFNLPHHIGMVWEELAFDDAVSYTLWEIDCSTAKCYTRDWDPYPCPQGHLIPISNRLSHLPTLSFPVSSFPVLSILLKQGTERGKERSERGKWLDRQAYRQTYRQADRQTYMHTGINICR